MKLKLKLKFRTIGNLALLIVIIGFFMPIACDQNGFELADTLKETDSTLDSILMYSLFFSAIIGCFIGVILLMKKRIPLVIDWLFLFICIGSGLFVFFNILRANKIDLQQGAYVILAGWAIALVAQIISKIKKEA